MPDQITTQPNRIRGALSTHNQHRRLRLANWLALAMTAIAIFVITFWPTPVDAQAHDGLQKALTTLHEAGVPKAVDYNFVEVSSNGIMFLPLGALLAMLLPLRRWWIAVLVGCATSGLIELIQLVFLPHRFASVTDIAANTTGALVGAAAVAAIRSYRLGSGRLSGGRPRSSRLSASRLRASRLSASRLRSSRLRRR
jgi:VanZ family protein